MRKKGNKVCSLTEKEVEQRHKPSNARRYAGLPFAQLSRRGRAVRGAAAAVENEGVEGSTKLVDLCILCRTLKGEGMRFIPRPSKLFLHSLPIPCTMKHAMRKYDRGEPIAGQPIKA